MDKIYDIVGVGFGPSNIALAVALEEAGFDGSVLFLERRGSPLWQPDMLLPGSDIQNHPCRDLITPRNPRSRYTFINFLYEHQLLFEHLNLGVEFPLRREYEKYVTWVASFFDRWVRYNRPVVNISRRRREGGEVFQVTTSNGQNYLGRSLVVAPGRTPNFPDLFVPHHGPQVFHLTEYLTRLQALESAGPLRHVCVVGGSQSAAEIMLHLSARHPSLQVSNVMRGFGYRLKDTSPFSERVYFPEFVDYYFKCDRKAKARLNEHLHFTNYSSADRDVIHALYLKMYEERLSGPTRLHLHTNQEIRAVVRERSEIALQLREVNTGELSLLKDIDAIVLATGFRDLGGGPHQEQVPGILDGIAEDLRRREDGVLQVERDYRLLPRNPMDGLAPLYLNGLCESSHGFGDAGSFSLLSLRGAEICGSILQALEWAGSPGRHGGAKPADSREAAREQLNHHAGKPVSWPNI